MARENSASFAKVGFIFFLGIAAIFAVVAYFGGWAGESRDIIAETYYEKPVSGLSVGSTVTFRGVPVGLVKSVSFVGRDYPAATENDREKIHITFTVNTELLGIEGGDIGAAEFERKVKAGLRATLRSNGITGLSGLELNYPRNMHGVKPISWTPKHVFIPPALSMFENLSDSLTRVVNHLNRMDLPKVASNLTSTVESASKLTGNVNELIESVKPNIGEVLENLAAGTASLREFVEDVKNNPSLLIRPRENEQPSETK